MADYLTKRRGTRGNQSLVTAAAMPLSDGDAVPNVTFKCRVRDETIGGDNPFTFKDVTTADLMAGQRVVLFAVRFQRLYFGGHFSGQVCTLLIER